MAGLLLQAGPLGPSRTMSPVLLQWGTGGYAGNAASPGMLQDVFVRVGGPDGTSSSPVGVKTMIHIASGNVIGDNLWLWRADHAADGPVTDKDNVCLNGLVVDGDDVTMYGLAVEHTLADLTVWAGERGRTFFYQSELPYEVTQVCKHGCGLLIDLRAVFDFRFHIPIILVKKIAIALFLISRTVSYLCTHNVCTHVSLPCTSVCSQLRVVPPIIEAV